MTVADISIETWLAFAASLFVALAGSRVASSFLEGRFARARVRRENGWRATTRAVEDLEVFRSAVLELGSESRVSAREERRLAELRGRLLSATARTGDVDLVRHARAYCSVGERFAGGDPFLGAEEEESEYLELLGLLTSRIGHDA